MGRPNSRGVHALLELGRPGEFEPPDRGLLAVVGDSNFIFFFVASVGGDAMLYKEPAQGQRLNELVTAPIVLCAAALSQKWSSEPACLQVSLKEGILAIKLICIHASSVDHF